MNEERMNRLREIRKLAVQQTELVLYSDVFSSPANVNELTDRLLTVKDAETSPLNQAIFEFFAVLHAEDCEGGFMCEIEDVAPAKQALATKLVDLYQHEAKRLAREVAEDSVKISYVTNDGEYIKA